MAIWIKTQPTAQTVALDGTAVFAVEAESTTGETLYYQWQWQGVDGTYWGESGLPTANTPTLEVPGTMDRNGQKYRCYITTAGGDEAVSDAVVLTVVTIIVTVQPKNATVLLGAKAVFSVRASGSGLTYRWQCFNPATSTEWANSTAADANTNTLTIEAAAHRDGYQYRCVISDTYGNQAISAVATLIITDSADEGIIKYETIKNIADAIREQLENSDKMYPEDMAAQIGRIGANSSILMSGAVTVSTWGISEISLGSAFPSTGNFLLCMWLSTGPSDSSGYVDGTIIVVSNGTQKIGLSNIASNYWKNAYSTSGTAIDVSTGVVTAGEFYSSLQALSYRGEFYGTYNWVCIDLAEVGFTV